MVLRCVQQHNAHIHSTAELPMLECERHFSKLCREKAIECHATNTICLKCGASPALLMYTRTRTYHNMGGCLGIYSSVSQVSVVYQLHFILILFIVAVRSCLHQSRITLFSNCWFMSSAYCNELLNVFALDFVRDPCTQLQRGIR